MTAGAPSGKKDGDQPPSPLVKPLPDDFAMCGFQWAEMYFPEVFVAHDAKIADAVGTTRVMCLTRHGWAGEDNVRRAELSRGIRTQRSH